MNAFARTRELDRRRLAVGIMAIGGIAISALLMIAPETWMPLGGFGDSGSRRFAAGMLGRLGLMMSALWLAWPSLRRPASWLPPGAIVLVIGAIAILAMRPRMVTFLLPTLAILITMGWFVKIFRR